MTERGKKKKPEGKKEELFLFLMKRKKEKDGRDLFKHDYRGNDTTAANADRQKGGNDNHLFSLIG